MLTDILHGTILFAHGSRDPLWRKPIEAVAAQVQLIAPAAHVRCAYLELTTPDLPTSAAELIALGVRSITVVPMFLGVGKHAREDLPLLMSNLETSFPQVTFTLRQSIAEESEVIAVMARIAIS